MSDRDHASGKSTATARTAGEGAQPASAPVSALTEQASLRQEPTPTAAAIFAAVPGIRGCCVGDVDGNLLDEFGESALVRSGLTGSATLLHELEWIGAQFRLGTPNLVTTKGAEATLVTTFLANCTISLDVEANRPLKNIEATLLDTDWKGVSDWLVSDLEIEYFPDDHPISLAARSLPPTEPEPSPSVMEPPEVEISIPEPVIRNGDPLVVEECAALRRALIKGRLAVATRCAANLRELPSPADHPFNTPDSEHVLRPLVNAIANIVAGDTNSGLAQLEVVRSNPGLGPSLQWAAQLWSARASASSGSGLEAARVYAESSLHLAESLDAEARAMSLLVLADIKNISGELSRSLKLVQSARDLFMAIGDSREEAACWLLEARTLSALNRDEESLHAAENARDCRPSWPAPVTFLIKRALRLGDLDGAERALESLAALTPVQPEAERDRLLIEHVRSGELPAETACLYLDLLDAPVGPKPLRQLQEIAAGFPYIVQFRETLGWKLLRAGEAKAARAVFQRLNSRDDLPDDIRTSVLLGLGFLATDDKHSAPSSVKLRAAVNAALMPVEGARAAPPIDTLPRKTDPMDLRHPEASLTPSPGNRDADKVRRKTRTGPTFSGTLRLFTFHDLLEILRAGQKTGTLVCSSAAGIGAVHLRSGKVTGAAAPGTGELRDYLIARKTVTLDQLRIIDQLPEEAQVKSLFDLTLLEHGLVNVEQVRQALRDQVLAAFAEIMCWKDGKFAFDLETLIDPPPSGVEIELDPRALLLELNAAKELRPPGSSETRA